MRVKRLTTWLVLGVAVALAYAARRRRGAPRRRAVPVTPSARPVGPWGSPAEAEIDPTALGLGDEAGEVFVLDDDDDEAQAEGENWLEHLQASAAELGPEPERVLDMSDDADPHAGHHKTETRDTPVADHGAAGPRGL
jgi:hypothetical protein